MKPRPYQEEMVQAVFGAFQKSRATLVVMPTGTGKTICFAEIIKRWESPVEVQEEEYFA